MQSAWTAISRKDKFAFKVHPDPAVACLPFFKLAHPWAYFTLDGHSIPPSFISITILDNLKKAMFPGESLDKIAFLRSAGNADI
jgi:hypothetical protein